KCASGRLILSSPSSSRDGLCRPLRQSYGGSCGSAAAPSAGARLRAFSRDLRAPRCASARDALRPRPLATRASLPDYLFLRSNPVRIDFVRQPSKIIVHPVETHTEKMLDCLRSTPPVLSSARISVPSALLQWLRCARNPPFLNLPILYHRY